MLILKIGWQNEKRLPSNSVYIYLGGIDCNGVCIMKPHTKLYMTSFGYDISDFMACECCGDKGIDIHHIQCKGKGGSNEKDYIENLMAVCRPCHIKYGDKKNYKKMLYLKHSTFMDLHGVKFDRKLMAELIEKS